MKQEYEECMESFSEARPVTMELLDAKLNALMIATLMNREYMEKIALAFAGVQE